MIEVFGTFASSGASISRSLLDRNDAEIKKITYPTMRIKRMLPSDLEILKSRAKKTRRAKKAGRTKKPQ